MTELNRRLGQEIAERTRQLSQTWNLSPDILGVLNQEGYFESSNPAWQAILGWPEEKIRTTPFFEFIHPDDQDRTYDAWQHVNNGNPVLRFENRYRSIEGQWHWLSWVVVPEGGKFYASARDITAGKAAETHLASAQEALRQAQKMEAIGQLTGGVAHDFNNLLTVINGSVELLQRPGLSDDKRQRYLKAIGDTSARATKLTGQLLAFARRQALKPEIFDIGYNVVELGEMLRALIGSGIILETTMPDSCFINADRTQFENVIVNLAINARDAMNGEGKLTIIVGPVSGIPAVRENEPVVGDFVAIAISDTGTGISPDDIARIFEPFFTTKAQGHGTGLGLSQVIGFARQSNGEIRVDSVVGEGTTFTLYLPRACPDRSAELGTGEVDPIISGDGVCVLVVDDNAQVGEFASQALRELGFDSMLAANAQEALDMLHKQPDHYHIVFSDVVMPGMSGLDLADEIREHYPDLPFILTSGYSHVLTENGPHGFELLHKPYSIEQLSGVFRKVLAWQFGKLAAKSPR